MNIKTTIYRGLLTTIYKPLKYNKKIRVFCKKNYVAKIYVSKPHNRFKRPKKHKLRM